MLIADALEPQARGSGRSSTWAATTKPQFELTSNDHHNHACRHLDFIDHCTAEVQVSSESQTIDMTQDPNQVHDVHDPNSVPGSGAAFILWLFKSSTLIAPAPDTCGHNGPSRTCM